MENGAVNGLLKGVDIKRVNTTDICANTHFSVSPDSQRTLVNKRRSPGIFKESTTQGFNLKNNTHDPGRLNIMRKRVESDASTKKFEGCDTSKKQSLKQASKRMNARSYTDFFRKKIKVSDTPSNGRNVLIPNGSNVSMKRDSDGVHPCSKKQRVNSDSKQHNFRNSEADEEFHKNSHPKSDKSPINVQDDMDYAACSVCMKGGEILCCGGEQCKRGYHLSCVDPPLSNFPSGVWHCIWCVRKKILDGVHSVSKKIESIWEIRDAIADNEDKREKEYFVKYQGLAHVHNRWVPETQMLMEAPDLVTTFNTRNEILPWKTEWTVPDRLLQKRLLIFPKNDGECCNEFDETTLNCSNEWLVKWSGLEYDQATWELDNASFLWSSEALKMIRDYESRHKKAEELQQSSTADEELKSLNKSFEVPSGVSPRLHDCVLSSVKKLRGYWQKGQNAAVIDELERAVKVISFILSLLGDVCRPFLIISTSTDISMWEATFSQLAPSANIVVYRGNGNTRRSIRSYEFYTEKGCMLFEVLLSAPEIVVEDFDFLECIAWEAIIVDECQRPRTLRHLKTISMLSTHMRLLVVSGLLKGSADYVNVLSFLRQELDGTSNHQLEIGSNANISVLKERLTQFIAYESTSSSTTFHEYWVPVQLSTLQLEQYCAILLSNSMLLRSCSKYDPPDLDEVLVSLRKCCDHPYLVDQSLQSFVTKGLPGSTYLDVGIKLSGKLQLLDKMLLEMKSRGSRVLIMFQSLGGSGNYSIGNILDDLVYQKFGKNSYIRISNGSHVPSRKQADLDMFNNNEAGKFVMLIENRICLRSIKRLSVDAVILFDSDSEPRNDIVALEKITFNSQYEQLKVFRLYSSCTIEEKNLILVKEGVTLGKSISNLSRSALQMLLQWGASYLFEKLDDFHGCHLQVSEEAFFNELFLEFSGKLSCSGENSNPNCSKILKIEQFGVYTANISLLGESHLVDCNKTTISFWKNLLEGRYPQWKLLPGPSQRTRRKAQNFNNEPNTNHTKKGNELISTVDMVALQSELEDKDKISAGRNTTIDPEINIDKVKEGIEPYDAQSSTKHSLKSEIYRLCQILHYPEVVEGAAIWLLDYLVKNYDFSWDGAAMLNAFQISLCWAAASFSNHKIDHKESLLLAKAHFNYECKETDAKRIYLKLRKIKKVYKSSTKNMMRLNRSGNSKSPNNHEALLVSSRIEEEFKYNPMTSLGDAVSGTQSVSMDDMNSQGNKQSANTITPQDYPTTSVPISMPLPDDRSYDKGSQNLESSVEETLCCSRQAAGTMNIDDASENNLGNTFSDEPASNIELHWNSDLVHTNCGSILLSESRTPMTDVPIMQRIVQSSDILRTVSDARAEADTLIVKTDVQSSGALPILSDEFAEADVLIKQTAVQSSGILRTVSDAGAEANTLIVKANVQSSGALPILSDEVAEADVLIKQTAVQSSGILQTVSDAGAEADTLIVKTEVQSSGIFPIVSDEIANADVLIKQTAVQSSGILRTVSESDEVDMASSPKEMVTTSILPTIELDMRDVIISETEIVTGNVREPEGTVVTSILPSDSRTLMADVPIKRRTVQSSGILPILLDVVDEVDVLIKQTAVQSSDILRTVSVSDEVDVADSPKDMVTTSILPTRELDERDAILSETATVIGSLREPEGTVVTSTCEQLPTGTGLSLLQLQACPVDSSISPLHQLLLSRCQSSPLNNQVNIHTSMNSQQNQGVGVISQQAQVPRQRNTEDITATNMYPLPGFPVQLPGSSRPSVEDFLHNHPLSTCWDPLQNQMERLQKEKELACKNHEKKKSQLILECNKEVEEICKKYKTLLEDAETALAQKAKDLDTCLKIVHANKLLAEALVHNHVDAYGSSSAQHDMTMPMNQLHFPFLHPAEQRDRRHPQLPAITLMNCPIAVSQSLQLASHPPATVLTDQAGMYSNSITRYRGEPYSCTGLGAPSPHLQPYGNFPTYVSQTLQLGNRSPATVLTNQAGAYSNSTTRYRGDPHSCAGLLAPDPQLQPYGNFPYAYTSNHPTVPIWPRGISPRPNYPNHNN